MRKPYALACGSGLVWALAFPLPNLAGLAWIAPALILASAFGEGRHATLRLGYVAGLAHYLAALYWILLIPVADLPFPGQIAPIIGWLALGAYLSLHPALWMWACWKLFPAVPGKDPTRPMSLADRLLQTTWLARALWAFHCGALWVTWEMIQARLWTGFPWNMLGASQYRLLPLTQISSIVGVYGLAFLIVWTSASLLCAGAVLIRHPQQRWLWLRELALPGAAVVLTVLFGVLRLSTPLAVKASVAVALIQPSIPQESIWDAAKAAERFQQLLKLSHQALTNHPDLIVWPEAALPGVFRFEPDIYEPVIELARSNHVWLVIGADDLVWRKGPRDERNSYDTFNSSFLISPEGKIAGTYQKRQLVIFGEYVPLQRWLPFMKYLTPIGGSFSTGKGPVSFPLQDLGVKTSVLICFEDVFPHLARPYVTDDLDFLLNITNNGWFGEGAAQWQHAANAVFRAVENGVPLVRCANNGLTCWVDERGALHDIFGADSGNVYGAGYQIVHAPLLAGGKRSPTFYQRYGDWFGYVLMAWSLCMIVLRTKKDAARVDPHN